MVNFSESWNKHMNAKEPIAVLAGTPVDTQMGVTVLASAGLASSAFARHY